mgnify:CR=1 FL=1
MGAVDLCITTIIPTITPDVTIKGARIFIILEKLGSTHGTVKIQLVRAPPIIARAARTLTLMIWVMFSEEYWEEGLTVGANIVYMVNRVEYAVVKIVATTNIMKIIKFFCVISIVILSIMRSFE